MSPFVSVWIGPADARTLPILLQGAQKRKFFSAPRDSVHDSAVLFMEYGQASHRLMRLVAGRLLLASSNRKGLAD